MDTDRKFGFTVEPVGHRYERAPAEEGGKLQRLAADPPYWAVYLPHQTDQWGIAGYGRGQGRPHAEAVAQLERFIAEAQQALAALREGREFGDPD